MRGTLRPARRCSPRRGTRREPRRPTDGALAITSLIILLIAGTLSQVAGQLDDALAELLAWLPGFLEALWRLAVWAAVGWAVVVVVASLVRGRLLLVRDILLAELAAVTIAVVTSAIVLGDGWSFVSGLADTDDQPGFPPGLLTLATAAIATASPHLSRPYRHLGRWLIGSGFVAALLLEITLASGGVAAISVGLLAAALVHLAFGSPGGRPDAARIRLALEELGIDVDDLVPASMQREGAVLFDAHEADGRLAIKVYGRDAWDGQLLSTLWRLAWYRDTHRTARLSRVELVEHEGFVTLLADRAGVRVPNLRTAGSAGRGDALVVVRADGVVLAEAWATNIAARVEVGDDGVTRLWSELDRLHDAGITHRQIDLDRVLLHDDGTLGFGDLSSATVTGAPASRLRDRAQVLALSILVLGGPRALAVARTALGDEGAPRDLAVPPGGGGASPTARRARRRGGRSRRHPRPLHGGARR